MEAKYKDVSFLLQIFFGYSEFWISRLIIFHSIYLKINDEEFYFLRILLKNTYIKSAEIINKTNNFFYIWLRNFPNLVFLSSDFYISFFEIFLTFEEKLNRNNWFPVFYFFSNFENLLVRMPNQSKSFVIKLRSWYVIDCVVNVEHDKWFIS